MGTFGWNIQAGTIGIWGDVDNWDGTTANAVPGPEDEVNFYDNRDYLTIEGAGDANIIYMNNGLIVNADIVAQAILGSDTNWFAIGSGAGTAGSLTLSGAFGVTSDLPFALVGYEGGGGTLDITGGAFQLDNFTTLIVGNGTGSVGIVNISGSGTQANLPYQMSVGGNSGAGTLNIINGGSLVEGAYIYAADTIQTFGANNSAYNDSTATINVSGVGSYLQFGNAVYLGVSNGSATLDVTNGGNVVNQDGSYPVGIKVGGSGLGSSIILKDGTITSNIALAADGYVTGYGDIVGDIANSGTITASGGTLDLNGALSGSGAVVVGAGATVNLPSMGDGTLDFADGSGVADISALTTDVTVNGFVGSDVIILNGISVGLATEDPDTGVVSLPTSSGLKLNFEGLGDGGTVIVTAYQSGTTEISFQPASPPCFASGTRIATERGDVAVEKLQAGDKVRTADGGFEEIQWLGRRPVNLQRHPRPWDVQPVRVRAGAFGEAMPQRDLYLSPDHAVFIDGVLIPIRYLLNGATIVQENRKTVTYHHVELTSHKVVLANGLPCESFLDTGNRAAFANGGTIMSKDPDFARDIWAKQACAPMVTEGRQLIAVQECLLKRAQEPGNFTTAASGLTFRTADGRDVEAKVTPVENGERFDLSLPKGTTEVRLYSRSWVPMHMLPGNEDARRLGVAVTELKFYDCPVDLASSSLASGWHSPEAKWRWTDGAAVITNLPPFATRVSVTVSNMGTYWEHQPIGAARPAMKPRVTRAQTLAA